MAKYKREKVFANWSGSYPCLCSGQWTLIVNGKNVSSKIPESLRISSMNTYKTYETWRFGEHYDEIWEDYEDGLKCDKWIADNDYWLKNITADAEIKRNIFFAINEKDFRSGSCGGCI